MSLYRYDFTRRYPRKNYLAEVVFAFQDRVYRGILKNISLGGAFIETTSVNQLSAGDLITISIPFTRGKCNVKQKARVTWQNDDGFAVEFC